MYSGAPCGKRESLPSLAGNMGCKQTLLDSFPSSSQARIQEGGNGFFASPPPEDVLCLKKVGEREGKNTENREENGRKTESERRKEKKRARYPDDKRFTVNLVCDLLTMKTTYIALNIFVYAAL